MILVYQGAPEVVLKDMGGINSKPKPDKTEQERRSYTAYMEVH